MGFILSDLLTNCERVSDHCSNIAVAQIETALNAYQENWIRFSSISLAVFSRLTAWSPMRSKSPMVCSCWEMFRLSETALNAYQAHEYLNALKTGGDAAFRSIFDSYRPQFTVKKEGAGRPPRR